MLDQVLGGLKGTVVSELSAKLGLSGDQAGGFLKQALGLLEGALKGGKLDVASLLSGNLQGAIGGLDLGSLTSLVGGDAGKARTGLETVVQGLANGAKSTPDASALLSQIAGGGGGSGGIMGQVSSLAGKLFGKQ